MLVSDFQKVTEGHTCRVSAQFEWEDCERPSVRVYFEAPAEFNADMAPNPNAFLLAACIPARRHGERRVKIDGSICSLLASGIDTSLKILHHWYQPGEEFVPLLIEASLGESAVHPLATPRTAVMMSGGVDSLTSLRTNRLDYPLSHPGSVRDGLFIHGFEVGGYRDLPENRGNAENAISRLTELGQQTDFTLIPVSTNVRHLDDNDGFFHRQYYGAVMAAVTHVFAARISRVLIPSGASVDDLDPIGSHPMLDVHHSSGSVEVRHDGVRLPRFQKVGLLSDWDLGLGSLRACFNAFRPDDHLNCGRCEKCFRTMTELLVHGKLAAAPTYSFDDLQAQDLQFLDTPAATTSNGRQRQLEDIYRQLNDATVFYWDELLTPLRSMGRNDLADVIESKLRRRKSRLRKVRRVARSAASYLRGRG